MKVNMEQFEIEFNSFYILYSLTADNPVDKDSAREIALHWFSSGMENMFTVFSRKLLEKGRSNGKRR